MSVIDLEPDQHTDVPDKPAPCPAGLPKQASMIPAATFPFTGIQNDLGRRSKHSADAKMQFW